ncbi:MAG: hypothetical protein ACJ8F7_07700 [Gemmataceae bacterium]
MNRVIARTLAAACLAAAVSAVGCVPYRNWVDVCYPERYNNTARREVVDAFAPQVQNGHVLDQTIWNYDFDKGTDRLNSMGVEKLKYLARRRPQPDPNLFLATANDIDFDPDKPQAFAQARRDLDARRTAVVQKYLGAYMDGRPMNFEVMIHDPFEVGYNAIYAGSTAQRLNAASANGPLGTLSGGGVGTAQGAIGGNQTGQFPPGQYGGQYGPYGPGAPGTGTSGSSSGSSSSGSSSSH